MPDFEIVSPSDPSVSVRVANCSLEHAQSVLQSLQVPTWPGPRDIELREVKAASEKTHRRFWRL